MAETIVADSYMDLLNAYATERTRFLRRLLDQQAELVGLERHSAMEEGDHWWTMQRQKMLRTGQPDASLTTADPSEMALQPKDEAEVISERLREPHGDISTDRWREKFKAFDTPHYRRG